MSKYVKLMIDTETSNANYCYDSGTHFYTDECPANFKKPCKSVYTNYEETCKHFSSENIKADGYGFCAKCNYKENSIKFITEEK